MDGTICTNTHTQRENEAAVLEAIQMSIRTGRREQVSNIGDDIALHAAVMVAWPSPWDSVTVRDVGGRTTEEIFGTDGNRWRIVARFRRE